MRMLPVCGFIILIIPVAVARGDNIDTIANNISPLSNNNNKHLDYEDTLVEEDSWDDSDMDYDYEAEKKTQTTPTPRRRKRESIDVGGDPCSLPLEEGSCSRYTMRWYHHGESGQCRPFIYSGCGGNSNSFVSRQQCRDRCSPPGTEQHEVVQLEEDERLSP
ncbi:uncharacterized protein LOC144946130 [Lampetra fluviatilis]